MSHKRRNSSSQECETPVKRQRQEPVDTILDYDDTQLDESDEYETETDERPQVHASTGQTGAFPGLNQEDDDIFYGPAADGLDYLRMVRSEAKGIPDLLVAQLETQSGTIERAQEDEGGYWEDDAYIAIPQPQSTDVKSGLPHAQARYYEVLLAHFRLVRATVRCIPPLSAIEMLTSSQPISFPANSKNARLAWEQCLRTRDPSPTQVACMDENSVYELLRFITRKMRGFFQQDDVELSKRMGTWVWSMLGKCPDRGEMTSEEIALLRDLARKALDVRDWLQRKNRVAHAISESDEEKYENGELSEEGEECEGGMSTDIQAARARFMADATNTRDISDAPANEHDTTREKYLEAQKAEREKLVALDMVLTVYRFIRVEEMAVPFILVLLALIITVLGSSISNGTCYYKAGEEADSIYSPCGNAIDGVWPCCQLGDKCNDHNSCTWDAGGGVYYTYVAGCTDPTYSDQNCPFKSNFSDYQWVGLAWDGCTVKNDQVNWDGCDNDGYPRLRRSTQSEGCQCHDENEPLFQGPTGLVAEGVLPKTKMGEITWFAGWEHTDSVPSFTTSGSTPTTIVTISPTGTEGSSFTSNTGNHGSAAATTTASDSPAISAITPTPAPSNLSTGSKVGIGVGTIIASAFAVLGISFLARRIRKKHQEVHEEAPTFNNDPLDQEKDTPVPPIEPAMLDAVATQRDSPKSELPGTPAPTSMSRTASPSIASPRSKEEYDVVYRPFRYEGDDNQPLELSRAVGGGQWPLRYEPYRPPQGVGGVRREASGADRGQEGGVHELPG